MAVSPVSSRSVSTPPSQAVVTDDFHGTNVGLWSSSGSLLLPPDRLHNKLSLYRFSSHFSNPSSPPHTNSLSLFPLPPSLPHIHALHNFFPLVFNTFLFLLLSYSLSPCPVSKFFPIAFDNYSVSLDPVINERPLDNAESFPFIPSTRLVSLPVYCLCVSSAHVSHTHARAHTHTRTS